jgi:DNA polymerase-3 subunit gamma/tau
MTYTVLARKYRPQTFADLVGQEHVTRTLSNALTTGRVAHAFLFTGVRGVGKTTSARILAKALNCESGPTPLPCNVCDACREITAGTDMDVLEMDGASNNSVDDVRRLQESIPYRPARDNFKVVIVDEVHMLSTGAFNAFLKTLEEPPPHVKFIFATTEIHKVPVTIRSRCQRYDFRLIPQAIVAKRVRDILLDEGIDADDAAVAIVAREAAGSMRDALTLLDQIVAFSGSTLRGEEVARSLGLADRGRMQAMVAAVLDGDARMVLELVRGLAEQGIDLVHFTKQLVELARDLVVVRVTGEDARDLVDLVDEEWAEAKALAARVDSLEMQRVFQALSRIVDDVARSNLPRMVLEMGLVRIATRPPLRDLAEVITRLEALESGAPAQRAPKASAPAASPSSAGRYEAPKPRPASFTNAPEARVAPPKLTVPPVSHPDSQEDDDSPSAPVVNASSWRSVVDMIKSRRPALGACLEHGSVRELSADKLVLVFPKGSFFGEQATSPEAKSVLADAAFEVLSLRPKVVVELSSTDVAVPSIAAADREKLEAEKQTQREEALAHPRVLEALEVFPEGRNKLEVNVSVDGSSRKS